MSLVGYLLRLWLFIDICTITSVNNNHVDNYFKEILAFVYYGVIVNNRPKNGRKKNLPIVSSSFKAEGFLSSLRLVDQFINNLCRRLSKLF